ncbi:MAG: PadR family transcriptional regulator [Syntrophales bacterium]
MDVGSTLLGFLMYRSMTGYELKKFFSMSFSFFSGLSYGSIYPALKKMGKGGLVTMRLEVQDGAPNRKVYTITRAGKKAFIAALKSPLPIERHKNAFLMRLFFFAHLPPKERLETANRYLNSIKQAQKELEAARPKIEDHADPHQHLCFQFGVNMLRDMSRNISGVVKALDNEDTHSKN